MPTRTNVVWKLDYQMVGVVAFWGGRAPAMVPPLEGDPGRTGGVMLTHFTLKKLTCQPRNCANSYVRVGRRRTSQLDQLLGGRLSVKPLHEFHNHAQ